MCGLNIARIYLGKIKVTFTFIHVRNLKYKMFSTVHCTAMQLLKYFLGQTLDKQEGRRKWLSQIDLLTTKYLDNGWYSFELFTVS